MAKVDHSMQANTPSSADQRYRRRALAAALDAVLAAPPGGTVMVSIGMAGALVPVPASALVEPLRAALAALAEA